MIAVFHYKIVNSIAPNYLNNMLPDQLHNIHAYNTRNSNDFQHPFVRTTFYSSYFLPATIRIWNQQPIELRSSSSLAAFKNNIKAQHNKKLLYYYSGSHFGQVFHASLIMNCSILNHHLFLKNLILSPNCTCGEIETTEHFLLKCQMFNIPCQRYIYSGQN